VPDYRSIRLWGLNQCSTSSNRKTAKPQNRQTAKPPNRRSMRIKLDNPMKLLGALVSDWMIQCYPILSGLFCGLAVLQSEDVQHWTENIYAECRQHRLRRCCVREEMMVSVASELNDSVGGEKCNERPTGIHLDASSP
jgi:hypothetical protein